MAMRKRQLWFLIPLVLFLIIIALFYTRLGKDTTVVTNTSLNRALPSFSLPSLGNPSSNVYPSTVTQTAIFTQCMGILVCDL